MSDEERDDTKAETADDGSDVASPVAEAPPEGPDGEVGDDDSAAVTVNEDAIAGDAMSMPEFGDAGLGDGPGGEISMLDDVALKVSVELGRTRMHVEDVLRLIPEAVVELDKAAGDPVDVFVNGRHVARGEVLVLNENFCVRINEVIRHSDADG